MNSPDNNLLIALASTDEPAEGTFENLHFYYFPAYAKFLLDNCVEEFAEEQLRLSRVLNLPLLRFFESFTESEIVTIGIEGVKEMLNYCSQNKSKEYINISLGKWVANQLPVITRNQVVVEDISIL